MKKYLSIILALIFLLTLSPACLADKTSDGNIGCVVDPYNYISSEDKSGIEAYIKEAFDRHGYSIVIVFDDYLPEYDSERAEYTERYYANGNFSLEGIMLFVGMESRTYDIYSSHGNGHSLITEKELDNIDNRVYSRLSSNDFSGGARVFAELSLSAIETGGSEVYYFGGKTKSDLIKGFAISFGLGAIVALIVLLVMKSGMKGIRQQQSAGNYLKRDSLKITSRHDRFLYSTVTKVRRDTESSSGGGRSSSRSSGGSHRGGSF